MDSLLIALLDALFHTLGKGIVRLLSKLGVSTDSWTWGGYVVVGFVGFALLCIFMFFIIAAALN
jgi:hypothetical protein